MDELEQRHIEGKTVIINITGAMHFTSVVEQMRQIRGLVDFRPRAIVLRLRRVNSIDSSGLAALSQIHTYLEQRDIPLLICGVDKSLLRILERAGFVDKIGANRVASSHDLVFDSVEQTLALVDSLTTKPKCSGPTAEV